MIKLFSGLFGGDPLAKHQATLQEINKLEETVRAFSDEELKAESLKLREEAQAAGSTDSVTSMAFALVREAARRTLKQRPYDVQVLGGLVLHSGAVAEMMTGEGKTLSAVGPAYLNALLGKGVHLVTVNEYLARRDAVWMGQIYRALGLSVACLVPNAAFLYDPEWHAAPEQEVKLDEERDETGSFLVQQEFLRPVSRREAYQADITYGTNHEFGFDYLRDHLSYRLTDQVQRGHYFAIIDEVDSILIDEARTPLIISAPDEKSSEFYKAFARIVSHLKQGEDYEIEEKKKTVTITQSGIEKVEKMMGVENIYAPEHLRLVHYMEESLKAKALFRLDRDYVVKNNEIVIVDEFTGRLLAGRRYNGGLHQAIEAKENVPVKEESRTYGKISIQNYFRMYKKISGMTGTAQTSAEEFHKVYDLEVMSVPPNRPVIRKDESDMIYKNAEAKWRAVVRGVKERHEKGQPILVGTTSIEKNELISGLLREAGVPHEVLNAKNNEREGALHAQAGRKGAVTVATNMAGRGVDIILGGNPPVAEEAEEVRSLGGLHVVGTERHEARRIDNQLRGRAGRQGDPGSSQFYLSLDDDLLRIFGGDRLKGIMERFDVPEDEPIQVGFVSKAVAQAQSRVEGANFDIRKHMLEYDDVLNKQRAAVYKKRTEIMEVAAKGEIASLIFDAAAGSLEHHLVNAVASPEGGAQAEEVKKVLEEAGVVTAARPWPADMKTEGLIFPEEVLPELRELITKASVETSVIPNISFKLLGILDMLWMNHLEDLEALSESVGLRAYGQRDPLVEYRQEARRLYGSFWNNFNNWVLGNIFKTEASPTVAMPVVSAPAGAGDIGRNEPCPCGSGKKWKKCGMLDTEEHRAKLAEKK
jgi:preprotein translocase subunit SecA